MDNVNEEQQEAEYKKFRSGIRDLNKYDREFDLQLEQTMKKYTKKTHCHFVITKLMSHIVTHLHANSETFEESEKILHSCEIVAVTLDRIEIMIKNFRKGRSNEYFDRNPYFHPDYLEGLAKINQGIPP